MFCRLVCAVRRVLFVGVCCALLHVWLADGSGLVFGVLLVVCCLLCDVSRVLVAVCRCLSYGPWC